MLQKITQFFKDVQGEFKKVTWPTKDQTIQQTGVVLVVVALLSAYLGVIDLGLSEVVKLVIK